MESPACRCGISPARWVCARPRSTRTYDSKAAIYDALFAEGYRQFDAEMADVALDPDDPVGSLTADVERFLAFCQVSIARYQLMFTRAIPDWEPSPEAYAVSVASYNRQAEAFATLGLEGQRAADLWTGLCAGLAAQQLANDPGGGRWVRLARDAAEMFIHHIGRKP